VPLIEELQTRWEKKCDGAKGCERFSIYKVAIQDGLDKLCKYYCKFDEKPAYVLVLSTSPPQAMLCVMLNGSPTVLHPYYKLHYIKIAWGGRDEQAAERVAGNVDAKNWKEEALRIFEMTV